MRKLLSVCLVSIVSVAGCEEAGTEAPIASAPADLGSPSETSAVFVETRVAEPERLSDRLLASGTIAAKQTSDIGALSEGVVDRIFVRVGDRVRQGDPLFRTRQIDYERSLAEAEAMRDVAQAELERAQTLVDRYTPLAPDGVIAGVVFDDAKTALAVAAANLRLKEASLQTARQALADTIVRAPFDGSITARYIDEGVYMSKPFSGMGNSAVVQIQECGIAAGILFVPESELSRLRLGLTGRLFVDGHAGPIESDIIILSDRVDPATRMAEFRMAFENPDCGVKAGQSVRAEVDTDPRSAILLPREAVYGSGEQRFVFVDEQGRARRLPVDFADFDADRVEILSGLKGGERIVTEASSALFEGASLETARPAGGGSAGSTSLAEKIPAGPETK